MNTSPKSGYIPTLDGWRAVAILAVLLSHSLEQWSSLPKWATFVYGCGPKGVQLFFAISGFLITSRLLDEHRRSGQFSLRAFYVRRVCRILPPALAYLIVVGVLAITGAILIPLKPWLAACLFSRNYIGGMYEWYTSHFWSLAVEEQFYLIWPALIALCGLRRSRTAALLFITAIVFWRWLDFHHHWGQRLFPEAYFWFRSDIVFDGLLWGCFYALVLQSSDASQWLKRRLNLATIAVLAVAIALTFGWQSPAGRTIQSALLPAIVVGTCLNPTTRLGLLLETQPMRWLGRMSYSVYIWQQAFLGLGRLSWLGLRLLAVMLAAGISYYVIEKPFTRLGHRLAPPVTPGHADLDAESISTRETGHLPAVKLVDARALPSRSTL